MLSGSSQFDLQLRDQFTHRFADRMSPMIEDGVPIGERIIMYPASVPAPHAGNRRDEVRSDASFDFHEVQIPINFLNG